MIDIHCHILPGVDDGSASADDSVEMASMAAESGIYGIVATPHTNIPDLYQNWWGEEMIQRLENLRCTLQKNHIPLTIYSGQEIFLTGDFITLFRQGKLITINGSVYPLVEFDMGENMSSALGKLERIVSEGLIPIVAHPERYEFVMRYEEAAQKIRDTGAFLQVNRGSIFGRFGRWQMHAAHDILRKRLADFIATDSHSPYKRTPYLRDAHEWIFENISPDYGDFLVSDNPERVLRNEKIFHY